MDIEKYTINIPLFSPEFLFVLNTLSSQLSEQELR